jgi:hypothetical protein
MNRKSSVADAGTPPASLSCRQALADLYEPDETAWLEESSRLIRAGCLDTLDYENLASYLEDMATRDRREIYSRLRTLLAHLLQWQYQPEKRSRSWKTTIVTQRDELENAMTKTLEKHAREVLARAYGAAIRVAAAQTGLEESAFHAECPFTLEQTLTEPLK